jgi:hypothetical protein
MLTKPVDFYTETGRNNPVLTAVATKSTKFRSIKVQKSLVDGHSTISPAENSAANALSARNDNAKVQNFLILAGNSSKVLDENGEPLSLYHYYTFSAVRCAEGR